MAVPFPYRRRDDDPPIDTEGATDEELQARGYYPTNIIGSDDSDENSNDDPTADDESDSGGGEPAVAPAVIANAGMTPPPGTRGGTFAPGTVTDLSYPNVSSPEARKIARAGGDPNQMGTPYVGNGKRRRVWDENPNYGGAAGNVASTPDIDTGMGGPVPATTSAAGEPTPAEESVLSPENAKIKAAHDASLRARGLPPEKPYTGPMATPAGTPTIVTDSHGRPNDVYGPDKLANQKALKAAIDAYEPQKAKGWWNRYLKPAIMGWAVGQSQSLNPGAGLGGAIGGVAGTAIHPEHADEVWKAQKQATTQAEIDRLTKARKEDLQTQLTQAQIDNLKTSKVKWQIVKSKDGKYVAVNQATGRDPQGNLVETPQSVGNEWRPVVDESGVWTTMNIHTGLDPNGHRITAKSRVQQPNGSWVDANVVYSTIRGENTQDRALDIKNQEIQAENDALEGQAKELEKERKGLDEAMKLRDPKTGELYEPPTFTKRDAQDNEVTVDNPRYKDWMERYRHLDDEIKALRGRKRALIDSPPRPGPSSSTPPGGGGKGKNGQKFSTKGYWP